MQNMAKELLDCYHLTRNKKNEELYKVLGTQYKKCLYELHGMYIKNRNMDFDNNNIENVGDFPTFRSINVFNVYNYLKKLPFSDLRHLYSDRMHIIENDKCVFLNRKCINTLSQTSLMFKN
jgi:hypothetical protein